MIESVLKILEAGLSLWESTEKRKYVDAIIKLKKEYYEEIKNPKPDNAILDYIEFRLQLLGNSFASQIAGSKVDNMQG